MITVKDLDFEPLQSVWNAYWRCVVALHLFCLSKISSFTLVKRGNTMKKTYHPLHDRKKLFLRSFIVATLIETMPVAGEDIDDWCIITQNRFIHDEILYRCKMGGNKRKTIVPFLTTVRSTVFMMHNMHCIYYEEKDICWQISIKSNIQIFIISIQKVIFVATILT